MPRSIAAFTRISAVPDDVLVVSGRDVDQQFIIDLSAPGAQLAHRRP
jgi:hypothetical protein